jgi:hypothetical protein
MIPAAVAACVTLAKISVLPRKAILLGLVPWTILLAEATIVLLFRIS